MYKILLAFSVVALVAGWATDAPGQNKATGKKASVAGTQEYAALRQYREMNGVVEAISPTFITLRVAYTHPDKVANTNSRNPRAAQQALMRALQNMKTDYIDFELPIMDKAAVRLLAPAQGATEFDANGNPKAKPAAPAAGGNLPGTAGKIDDISPGDQVDLHLAAPKTGDPAYRPQVKMIVQMKAAAAPPPQTKGKK